jgi:glucan phosphoethanolaminetransferase (alkaline phosphatase superfamily)
MSGIDFSPKSLLAFLTAVSFVAWLGGTFLKTANENVGNQIANIGFPVFIVCFAIWLIFIFLSIARNLKGL